MSERLQIQKCSNSTTCPLISNQSIMDKNRKPLVSRPSLIQTKLSINQPGDKYEQEADRVSEQIMRMPDPVLQRKCAKCNEDKEKILQAKGPPGQEPVAQVQNVPPLVHEVLRSAGQPLDPATRAFMEPRFGHDFSKVRVHSGPVADQSSRDVNAHAYTVGNNIVFGAGQFAPRSHEGQRLIAHELTHVVQQSGTDEVLNGQREQKLGLISIRAGEAGHNLVFDREQSTLQMSSGLKPLAHELTPVLQPGNVSSRSASLISAPHNIEKQDVNINVQPIEYHLNITKQTISQPILARYIPEAEVEAEVEIEPEAEAEPSPSSPEGTFQPGPGRSQRRAYAQSRSFYKMYEEAKKAPNYEAAKDIMERPVATLERGGAPPYFVTVSQKEENISIAGEYAGGAGNIRVRYKPHWFHVLDAIEHDVAAVISSCQLTDVFRVYFPETVLRFGRSIAGRANCGATISLKWVTEFSPNELDPDGSARTLVFLTAATKKTKDNPKITMDYLTKTLIQEWEQHEESENEQRKRKLLEISGPCQEMEVNRKGEDKHHDEYAKKVTGADKDFKIVAPGGTQCITDGREPMNPKNVWEVKTRHEWATSYGIPGAIFAPYFSGKPGSFGGPTIPSENKGRIMKIEEQRQRCLDVTTRCGFRYAYAFESKEAYEFMKVHWRIGGPPVYHR